MIIILLFIFVFLGLSLQSGYAFHSGTNLSFENSVQLSGIYANSGIVTNNDTIHYSIGYGGSGYESYGGTYRVNIGSGGCLQNYVSGTTNGVQYYGEDDSELDPGSVENCSDIKYFKVNIDGDKTIGQYTSASGNYQTKTEGIYLQGDGFNYESGRINKNGYINIKKHNESSYMDELYVYKNNESIFITQGLNAERTSPLNDNNYGTYQVLGDSGMELYVWENGSSQFVSSGDSNWTNKFNNNNQGTYRIGNNIYIRNGEESVLVSSSNWSVRADDGDQDETISEGGYANYYDEGGLYITDDTGNSTLVHSGNRIWGHQRYAGINIHGQGLFWSDGLTGGYDLYVWSGNEATFINHGTNFWSSKINDNGYATYLTITDTGYRMNLWNGTESLLIDEYEYELPRTISINNHNQFVYEKINPMTNENELKFWNGNNLLTIDSGNYFMSTFDIQIPENDNQIYYSKNNGSERELYIRDHGDKIFVGSGNGYKWMNDANQSGNAIYKTSGNEFDTIWLWDGETSSMIDTGYDFWGFSKTTLSGEGTYNKGYTTHRYDIGGFMKKIELYKTGDDIRDKIFINQTNFEENEYTYTIIGEGEISNLSKYGTILGSGFAVNSSGYIDISSLNYSGHNIYLLPIGSGGPFGINTMEIEWEYRPYEMYYFDFDIIMDSEISNSELENFTITGNYTTELDTTISNGEMNYSHPIYHE